MTPTVTRTPHLLTDTEHLLAQAVQTVGAAERHLRFIARDGYPTTAPGNGSPGGGSGFTVGSTTERAALDPRIDPPTQTLRRLEGHAYAAATLASDAIETLNGARPLEPAKTCTTRAIHAYRLVRIILMSDLDVDDYNWHHLHHRAEQMRDLAYTWSRPPTVPTAPPMEQHTYVTDLTGMWCESCMRAGRREPRYRGALCQWCYRFELTEGFPVPSVIAANRANGVKITEPMVAAYRDANKAGRRRRV